MLNEWQSIGLEIVRAVLTASIFVAQCVTQEADAVARIAKVSRD